MNKTIEEFKSGAGSESFNSTEQLNNPMNKTIAIDFDGVIHKYSKGWTGVIGYDEPIDGAKESMKLLHKHFKIVIFTVSLNPMFKNNKAKSQLLSWLNKWGFKKGVHYDEITNNKPPALVYIDDRGLRFENWDKTIKYLNNLLT